MLKAIKSKWDNLSLLGITDGMELGQRRTAKVTNQLIVCAISVSILYPPLLIKLNLPWLALIMSVIVLIEIGLLKKKKNGRHELATIIILGMLVTYVTVISTIRPDSKTELFLLPFSLFGFGLLKKRSEGWIFFVIIVTAFFTSLVLQEKLDPIIVLSQESKFSLWIFNYAVTFLICLYFILNILDSHVEYEELLLNQKELVQNQHNELQSNHKLIQESIRYAKKIQRALLPSQKQFEQNLKEAFVLYLPKDVVAGDFYWQTSSGNKTFFAVADCTGHGVPGALMSIICNNALNRCVKEFSLKEPGEILNKARDIVINEFSKSDHSVTDGMDIALCAIEGNKLEFSGANNPLWLIRNGEFIEIKANRQPVGAHLKMKPFENQTIDLMEDDLIYLFSDGFADQFGGKNNQKFYKKNLRSKLLSMADMSIDNQLEELVKCFENWKGNHDQIDDVCILGLRFSDKLNRTKNLNLKTS